MAQVQENPTDLKDDDLQDKGINGSDNLEASEDSSKSEECAIEEAKEAAVVTSNELLSSKFESTENLTEISKSDKLDELTSLEREIAELHHVEPTAPAKAQKVNDAGALSHEELHGEKVLLEMQPPSRNSTPAPAKREDSSPIEGKQRNDSSVEPLEEEDLIAVLKGVENEQKQEKPLATSSSTDDCDVAVGVTIEGEGEYQIMDVVDDEPEEEEVSIKDKGPPVTIVTSPKTYTNISQKLTKEEERNLAMEQIKGLKSRMDGKRRRKQDIKPLQIETNDLVSLLGADWSDDDTSVDPQESTENRLTTKPKVKPSTKNTVKDTSNSSPNLSTEEKHTAKRRNSPPKITSVVVLKPGSVKTTEKKLATDSVKEKKEPEPPTVQTQTTGFKRTRIIKRKIIWDPDAPETQFSFAKLVRPSTASPTTNKSNIDSSSITSSSSGLAEKNKSKSTISAGVSLLKKEQLSKKVRPTTPKDRKLSTTPDLAKTQVDEKGRRTITLKSQTPASAASPTNLATKTSVEEVAPNSSPPKRRSQTPVTNGANKKKKVSELDRLMSDEGAVNMLNSLENERQKIAGESSGDPPKSNMRSRSATVSERLVKRDLTPVKKETAASGKPKRIPKPKASSSWDYVYKQQASEDSMIIRRRSNSSYSSTASLHRLSLDSPASSTKVTKKSTPKAMSPGANNSATSSKSGNKLSPKSPNTTADTSMGDISLRSSNTSLAGTPNTSLTGNTFEFAKPESKSNQKARKSPQVNNPLTTDLKKVPSASSRRTMRSPGAVEDKDKPTTKSPTNLIKDDSATGVVLRRLGKVSQIIFNTNKSKIDYTFSSELLNILTETLNKLSADDECNVVVMTTNAPNFCHGVDFTDLTVGSVDKRKKAAAQLGASLKQFLKVLVTFPKPLIAGVNGSNIGLGVTILPLFDIVIASDKGSYETPYAKIGQVPEGYCIWDQLTKIRGTFKTKLLWLCEKLHSTESALSGLVNKLTAPNKVNEDALTTAKKIASLSPETYRVMKKTSTSANSELITTALDQEVQTIIEQWTSDECYENFKKYLQVGHW